MTMVKETSRTKQSLHLRDVGCRKVAAIFLAEVIETSEVGPRARPVPTPC